jgi:hypothetical protein
MRCRRELLVAILVYVVLDLSLPTMPGAFVFEPADSVESIGGGRVAARVVVLATPAPSPVSSSTHLHSDLPYRRPDRCEAPSFGCPLARCLPRAACDPSSASEDPH